MFTRTRYQFGSLRRKKRKKGSEVWEFRFYQTIDGTRRRKHMTVGSVEKYPTKTDARKVVEGFLLKLNAEGRHAQFVVPTFRALIDRYVQEDLPERYSTSRSYMSLLNNHIMPKWGDYPLDEIKALLVEGWLNQLSLASKTKSHIKCLMRLLFKCAERWELIPMGKNPMALVRVRNGSKRRKRPRVLTLQEFRALYSHLHRPVHRLMILVAVSMGLRVSELMALQWGDFDFQKLTVLIQRGIVHGRVDTVKTEFSSDELPVSPGLARVLQEWRKESPFNGDSDWVFANPATGKPYHQESILKKHIKRAAQKASLGPGIGWHTFRHTYRSWLGAAGTEIGVQRELMRHANISTTMDIYGRAMSEEKIKANKKVGRLLIEEILSESHKRPQAGKGLSPAPSHYLN